MDSIVNIINQVALINRKNAEVIDATGGRFNMFKVCGVNHYENTHSSIIAELLNPNGSHGLKHKLLECFIATLGDYVAIENFNAEKAELFTEYHTEHGRIDILIKDDQNRLIIIENKIYASDQPEQLKRYHEFGKGYVNGCQILYLTLMGESASEQSGGGISYQSISYKENIINWLEECVGITSRFPIVRETIIQYINHLKQLTNQDMDTRNKEEIAEFLSKIENLRAAKSVYQNYSAIYNHLAEKYFNHKMKEFATEIGLEYHYERSEETYIKFHLKNAVWKERVWIGFTFESNRCFYGLVNNLNSSYKLSEENRKMLHQNLDKLNVQSRKESPWWPFYAYYTNLSIDSWESEIIRSDNFFNECKSRINTILTAVEGLEL